MKKNSLFLMFIAFVFLFSAANVSAKSSIFKSVSETSDILEQSLETNNPQKRYWIKITNNSRYAIYNLYVSTADDDRWGPDQLGDFVLSTGKSYTITDVPPGEYDIRFVDEDGDKCDLRNLAIYANKNWALTTSWLTNCQGY